MPYTHCCTHRPRTRRASLPSSGAHKSDAGLSATNHFINRVQIAAYRERTGSVPAAFRPVCIDDSPGRTGVPQERTGAYRQRTGRVPGCTGSVPGRTGWYRHGAYRQRTGSVPAAYRQIQGSAGTNCQKMFRWTVDVYMRWRMLAPRPQWWVQQGTSRL